MSKALYLLILLIINIRAWDLYFINISPNRWLVIQIVYLMVGFIYYGKFEVFSHCLPKLKYWMWWVIGVLISMMCANYNYNQTLSQSIITYRNQLLLLQIPVLLKIAPTKEEITKATMWFVLFLWVIYFLQLNNPYVIVHDEKLMERFLEKGEVLIVPGTVFAAIPIFYYLGIIKNNFDFKSLAIVLVCFLFLFFMQNRSMLFSVTVLIGWTTLTIKHKNKWLILLIMAVLVASVAYSTADVWNALFEETAGQVDNEEYDRNKAYRYFIYEASPNIWCYIFGNGLLSTHATRHMINISAQGIFNSDVGFVGYWNYFGVFPIIVTMLMTVPVVFKKEHSHFLRCWAIQILICGLTVWCWDGYKFLFWALFYYLYYYELEENEAETQQQIEESYG